MVYLLIALTFCFGATAIILACVSSYLGEKTSDELDELYEKMKAKSFK